MSSTIPRSRAVRAVAVVAAAALMGVLLTAVGPAPAAAAAPPAQGLQFGHVLDMSTCARTGPITRFLNDSTLLARTSWVRIDLRGAGGQVVPACDVTTAYQSLLADIAAKAPQIRVIGLMSIDFIWGGGINVTPATFAAGARVVACSSVYDRVGVWEVWNEPSTDTPQHDAAYLTPDRYAQILGSAASQIRVCGDQVITGGITPDGAVAYLQSVDGAFRANGYGGYPDLNHAVDGIGFHPYVSAIGDTDPGHNPMNAFLNSVTQSFTRPLYLTEFGWQIITGISEINQCHNLINAFNLINTSWAPTQVAAAVWFTMQDFGDPTRNFGLLDDAGVARPAYDGYVSGSCAPRAPTNVVATAVDSTSIKITWTDNSTTEADIPISNGTTTVILPANTTSYTWSGLAPNTYMCFSVGVANSQGLTWAPYTCTTTPGAPSGPVATALDSYRIRVDWPDNSTVETGFWLSNGVTTISLPADSTSYVWSGLGPGTYMCFTVAYSFSSGSSPWSPYGCTTTPGVNPAAPSNVSATALDSTSIRITWTDNAADETGYRIYNGVTTVSLAANSTSYTWTGLTSGTYMCFAVYSVTATGSSPWSPYACTTTP
jgi:hypothetical protein